MTKTLSFALTAASALALAACSSNNDDAVENVDVNAPAEVNVAETENLAAEADTLQNQADQLNAASENLAANTDAATNAAEADTAVNGM